MLRMDRGACAVAVLLVLAACGDDGGIQVGTGLQGRAEVTIGDQPAAPPSFVGTMVANTNAAISVDGRTWRDLGSPNGITIPLQSDLRATVHGEVDAARGTFTHVRVILRDAVAEIRAGSTVSGFLLTDDVLMVVGGTDGTVEIVAEVSSFTVDASGRIAISFDLNSEAWVNATNVQDRVVSDSQVQQAATVRVQQLP